MAILKIKQYPIKGLQGTDCQTIQIRANQPIWGDRAFAIAQMDIGVDRWYKKSQLIHSGNTPSLVYLRAEYDGEAVVISHNGREACRFSDNITTANGFLSDYLGQSVQLLRNAPTFSDNPEPYISIQNKASFDQVLADSGFDIDDYRLRDNLLVDGFPAFAEQGWAKMNEGKINEGKLKDDKYNESKMNGGINLYIHTKNGPIILKFVAENGRCKTTNVNLQTAEYDINLPQFLMKTYNHTNLGFFTIAQNDGLIAVGDEISLG